MCVSNAAVISRKLTQIRTRSFFCSLEGFPVYVVGTALVPPAYSVNIVDVGGGGVKRVRCEVCVEGAWCFFLAVFSFFFFVSSIAIIAACRQGTLRCRC